MKTSLKNRTAIPFYTAMLLFAGFIQVHAQTNVSGTTSTSWSNLNATNLHAAAGKVSASTVPGAGAASQAISVNAVALDQDTITAGGALSGKIFISEDAKTMLNENKSIVININFDPGLLNANSFSVDLGNNNMGSVNDLSILYVTDAKAGQTQISVKKKDSLNKIVGSSMIAFKYVVTDDLAGYTRSTNNQDNAEIIDAKLIPITIETKISYVVYMPPVNPKNNILPSGTVNLYPNPAHNTITIDLGKYTGTSVQVSNMEGQVLKNITSPLMNNQSQIDIADLPVGMYTININTSHGLVVKKFSKTN